MQESLTHVAPKELKPPPFNTRTVFDDEKMSNLVASIAAGGIHEPIIGRKVNGHIEIVAGERRWRAATKAKVETVPVIIRDLTDAQALEVQLIENEQREDISALDQAAGFQRLMQLDPATYTAEALAERIGLKSASVYLRLKLLAMIEPAKEMFRAGQLEAGHAVLIARLAQHDQEKAVAWLQERRKHDHLGPVSVRDIKGWINKNVRIDLFGPGVAEEQPEVAKKLEKLKAKGVEVLQLSPNYDEHGEGVVSPRDYREATGKSKCAKSQVGAFVYGEEVKLTEVCVDKTCKTHFPYEAQVRREKVKAAKTQKESAPAKAKRLAAEAAEKRKRELAAALRPKLLVAILSTVKAISRPVLEEMVSFGLDQGSSYEYEDELKALGLEGLANHGVRSGGLKKATDRQLAQLAVFSVLEHRLQQGDLKPVAKEFGVDLKKLEKQLAGPVQTAAPAVPKAAAVKPKPQAKKSAARKKR